jgi:hypothetical protein
VWSTGSSKTLVVWCVESPCRDRAVPQQYHHNHQICADRVTCFRFSDRGASLALVGVALSPCRNLKHAREKSQSTDLFVGPDCSFPLPLMEARVPLGPLISFVIISHVVMGNRSLFHISLALCCCWFRRFDRSDSILCPPYHLCNVYLTSRTRSQQRTQSCTLDDQRPSPLARSTSVPSSPT